MKVEDQIKEIIEKIRPFLINDGGDVEFVKFENGTAYVKMVGNCANCLYSDLTMSEIYSRRRRFTYWKCDFVTNRSWLFRYL